MGKWDSYIHELIQASVLVDSNGDALLTDEKTIVLKDYTRYLESVGQINRNKNRKE